VAGVRVVTDAPPAPPGTLVTLEDAVLVACGDGAVRLERVQFPGRPWTTALEQVRGRRLTSGTVLGAAADRT
jgi:methionyl-tRNA formyltransferase